MKYEDRELKKGEKVKLFEAVEGSKEMTGEATYVGEETISFEVPKFKTVDGRIVYGYQCWWIPIIEAEKAKGELKEKKTIYGVLVDSIKEKWKR